MKSLKHNALMNVILNISNMVFPLITYPYIARALLVEANGRLSFAQSIISYFTLFATLGITTYGIKVCAQARDNKEDLSRKVQELVIINFFTTFISFVVLGISIIFVARFRQEWALLLIYSVNMLLNVVGLNWMYLGLEKYDYITIRSIVFKFISLILMFIFVHHPSDCYIYACITVFATAGSNIFNIIHARKYISFKPQGKYNIKQHLKPTFMMFSAFLASNIYMNLDNTMLGFIKGNYEVGIYYTAVRMQVVLGTFVTSVTAVLLPRMSYYFKKGQTDILKNTLKKSYRVLLMASIPVVAFCIFFARECILVIAGPNYLDAIIPTQIIMSCIIMMVVTNLIGVQILLPSGKEKSYMYAVIIGAVVDLVLNSFMIPLWGATGAAIATMAAQTAQAIFQIIIARDYVKIMFNGKKTLLIFAVTAIASVITVVVNMNVKIFFIYQLIVLAGVFFGVYALILWIIGYEDFVEAVEYFTRGHIRRYRKF